MEANELLLRDVLDYMLTKEGKAMYWSQLHDLINRIQAHLAQPEAAEPVIFHCGKHGDYALTPDGICPWCKDGSEDAAPVLELYGPPKQRPDGTLYREGSATGTAQPEAMPLAEELEAEMQTFARPGGLHTAIRDDLLKRTIAALRAAT